jgi:tetratricopeptide (TPR) repeat protein
MKAFEHDPAIQSLMLSNLGYSREAKKEYEAAAQHFDQIVQGNRFIMKDDALFSLARVYDGMGAKEKRLAALNRLVSDYKDSIYHDVARELVAGLK